MADPVVLKSDFEENVASSKWYISGDVQSMTEDAGNFARLNTGADGKTAYVRSRTIKLIPGNKYTLTYSVRVPTGSADYATVLAASSFYLSPDCAIYIPNGVTSEDVTYTKNLGDTRLYANATASVNRRKNMNFVWNVEGYETKARPGYSNTGYTKKTDLFYTLISTEDGTTPSSPNDVFSDWKKVTLEFTAEAETVGSTDPTFVVFQFRAMGDGQAKNMIYDIKDVKLVNKSVDGGAQAPALQEGQAFYNGFEEGFIENIAADLSELRLVSVEESEASYPVVGNKYLKYVSNNSSKGVAFNFTNNPNYKYKISYDLKIAEKGSGALKTTAASTELFDHSNATVGDWEHYEYDFTSATNGEVTVKLLASNSGWQVGIDNIKVEMVLNANLTKTENATKGTYAFNIRAETENNTQGLRFKSEIDFNKLNLTEGAKIVEYGTLVTVATNKANLKLENVDNTKVLAGVAFDADTGTDIRYSFDNDTGILVYTGVITGITPKNYDKELAVCGYTVVETVSGARFTLYDDICEISVLAAAEQIVAESQSEEDKAAAQKVIDDYNA